MNLRPEVERRRREMVEAGMTCKQIAAEERVSVQAIRIWARKAGVEPATESRRKVTNRENETKKKKRKTGGTINGYEVSMTEKEARYQQQMREQMREIGQLRNEAAILQGKLSEAAAERDRAVDALQRLRKLITVAGAIFEEE